MLDLYSVTETMVLNGDLGPGQTTNIALGDNTAERILAIMHLSWGLIL